MRARAGAPDQAERGKPTECGCEGAREQAHPLVEHHDQRSKPHDRKLSSPAPRRVGPDQPSTTEPRIWRAMTSRWISLVPSPISQTFASRIMRSTGYSAV